MDLGLVRTEYRSDGIFSEFRDAAGEQLFVTLERAYPDGLGGWIPKLVNGIYTCERRVSPELGYELFQIMNVPNCTYIEIHIGNSRKDSKGCVLVGMGIAQVSGLQMITQSKIAFGKFMDLQAGLQTFQLLVTG